MLTFFLHSSFETLSQATVTALIPLVLVNDTISREATRVRLILPYATSKESFAAITAGCTIMLSGRPIATNRASTQRLCILQCIIVGGIAVIVVVEQ